MSQKYIHVPVSKDVHRAVKTAAAQRGTTFQKLVQSTLAASFAFQTPSTEQQRERR